MVQKKRVRFSMTLGNTEKQPGTCNDCNLKMLLRPRKLFQMLVGTSVALAYIQFQLLSVTERRHLTRSISNVLGIDSYHFSKSSCKGLEKLVRLTNSTSRDIVDTGGLNAFLWNNIEGMQVDSLVQSPMFPKKPSSTKILKLSKSFLPEIHYGLWIFGYVIPSVSGKYKFAIASDDTSELWLSDSENPKTVRKIASVKDQSINTIAWTHVGEFTKYPSQISEEIFLQKCKAYFMEILFKQSVDEGFVEVAWRLPKSSAYNFELIHEDFLLPFALIEDNVNNTEEIKLSNENRELLWNRHIQRRDRLVKVRRLKNPRNREEELEGLVEQVVEKDF